MYLFHGKGKKAGGLNVMPLDKKWLNTLENDIIVKQNREHKNKKKTSPKKKKVTKTVHVVPGSVHGAEDDASATTNHSSNTVVTFISVRESKRAEFLRSQILKESHRKHPSGAPMSHISRQLNADTGMNCNIDYNTTNQLFSLTTDRSKFLTFNSAKKARQLKNGTLPPLEKTIAEQESNWDRRMYPTCDLFSDMTPREGGYYPDNVVSKRKEVRHKPVVKKGFSIRNDVQHSVDGGNNDAIDTLSVTSDNTTDDETYEKLVKELSKKGGDLSLNDLSQISKIRNPHDYINIIFRYIHILILGFDLKRCASKRDIVNGTGGEPDAKQTLLKECSPLLLYIQHINPLNIPLDNSKLAAKFFRAKILPMQPRELGRISTAFSRVVRWVVHINRCISVILYLNKEEVAESHESDENGHFKSKAQLQDNEEEQDDIQDFKDEVHEFEDPHKEEYFFANGHLEIHSIECKHLKSVELVGKNDPFVKLAYSGSDWVASTQPIQNVDDPVWHNVNMVLPVTAVMLEEGRISVEVWDQNTLMKDKLIGLGDTSVLELLGMVDKKTPLAISIQLHNDKSKPVGEVVLQMTLKSLSVQDEEDQLLALERAVATPMKEIKQQEEQLEVVELDHEDQREELKEENEEKEEKEVVFMSTREDDNVNDNALEMKNEDTVEISDVSSEVKCHNRKKSHEEGKATTNALQLTNVDDSITSEHFDQANIAADLEVESKQNSAKEEEQPLALGNAKNIMPSDFKNEDTVEIISVEKSIRDKDNLDVNVNVKKEDAAKDLQLTDVDDNNSEEKVDIESKNDSLKVEPVIKTDEVNSNNTFFHEEEKSVAQSTPKDEDEQTASDIDINNEKLDKPDKYIDVDENVDDMIAEFETAISDHGKSKDDNDASTDSKENEEKEESEETRENANDLQLTNVDDDVNNVSESLMPMEPGNRVDNSNDTSDVKRKERCEISIGSDETNSKKVDKEKEKEENPCGVTNNNDNEDNDNDDDDNVDNMIAEFESTENSKSKDSKEVSGEVNENRDDLQLTNVEDSDIIGAEDQRAENETNDDSVNKTFKDDKYDSKTEASQSQYSEVNENYAEEEKREHDNVDDIIAEFEANSFENGKSKDDKEMSLDVKATSDELQLTNVEDKVEKSNGNTNNVSQCEAVENVKSKCNTNESSEDTVSSSTKEAKKELTKELSVPALINIESSHSEDIDDMIAEFESGKL